MNFEPVATVAIDDDPGKDLGLAGLPGHLPCLRLVGCEPGSLEPADEGTECLSQPVRAASDRAVEMVEALATALLTPRRKAHDEPP